MTSAFPASAVRAAQERAARDVPPGFLLDRAVAGVAAVCLDELRRSPRPRRARRVVAVAGPGMNGADALLVAARLRTRGLDVVAVTTAERVYAPALRAARAAGVTVVDATVDDGRRRAVAAMRRADAVLDGIVGLGATGGLAAPAAAVVDAVPEHATVLAVDLPSGVDPDTGETPGPHVRADVTVAIGAWTPCLLLPPAAHAAGRVRFVDNGFLPHLPGPPAVRRLGGPEASRSWPAPGHDDHKYSRGVLGVVAGSSTYPGAAALACSGAVLSGVGIVRYVGPADVTTLVLGQRPEVVPGAGRVDAWLLGSGVEDDAAQDEAVAAAVRSGAPCVVDAGAIETCVRQRAAGTRPAPADRVLLTPHSGELSRALAAVGESVSAAEVRARPRHHARLLATRADATVLLKGAVTLVASPGTPVLSQADGPAWLATAGSGDVLAGVAGTLLAAGLDAPTAGALAAHVHGLAAHRSCPGGPAPAARVAEALPATIADLLTPPGGHARDGVR